MHFLSLVRLNTAVGSLTRPQSQRISN